MRTSWHVLLELQSYLLSIHAQHCYKLPSKANDSVTSSDLIHNLYVDNVVSGSCCEEAAVDYFTQIRSILGSANFNLHSWASNSKQLNNIARVHNVISDTNPVKVLACGGTPALTQYMLHLNQRLQCLPC